MKENPMQYFKETGQYGASCAALSFYIIIIKELAMTIIRDILQEPFRELWRNRGKAEGRLEGERELIKKLQEEGVLIPKKYLDKQSNDSQRDKNA